MKTKEMKKIGKRETKELKVRKIQDKAFNELHQAVVSFIKENTYIEKRDPDPNNYTEEELKEFAKEGLQEGEEYNVAFLASFACLDGEDCNKSGESQKSIERTYFGGEHVQLRKMANDLRERIEDEPEDSCIKNVGLPTKLQKAVNRFCIDNESKVAIVASFAILENATWDIDSNKRGVNEKQIVERYILKLGDKSLLRNMLFSLRNEVEDTPDKL